MNIEKKHYRVKLLRHKDTTEIVSQDWFERTFVDDQPHSSEGDFRPVDTFIKAVKFAESVKLDECEEETYSYITETCQATDVVVREQWLIEESPGEKPVLHSQDGAAVIVRDPITGRTIYEADYTYGFEHQTEWHTSLPKYTPC